MLDQKNKEVGLVNKTYFGSNNQSMLNCSWGRRYEVVYANFISCPLHTRYKLFGYIVCYKENLNDQLANTNSFPPFNKMLLTLNNNTNLLEQNLLWFCSAYRCCIPACNIRAARSTSTGTISSLLRPSSTSEGDPYSQKKVWNWW